MAKLTPKEKDRMTAVVKAILQTRAFDQNNRKEVIEAVKAEVMLSALVIDFCGPDWSVDPEATK